jgi:hypothetical protein
MQGQLSAMATDERPWVRVNPAMDKPFRIVDGKIDMNVAFSLTNIGKSPAANVRNHPLIVSGDISIENGSPKNSLKDEQNRACALANLAGLGAPIVFPNDSTALVLSQVFNVDDFKRKFAKEKYLYPAVAGCAVYGTTFDTKIHHTWFAFDIRLKSWTGTPIIDDGRKIIQPSNISFVPNYLGRNDAD